MSSLTLALRQSIGSRVMRLLRSAPPVPTSAMFALASIASCSTRPCIWHPATRSFSYLNRLRQESARNAEEEVAHQQASERKRLADRVARFRERYANDPAFRQKMIDNGRKRYRQPERRIKANACYRAKYQANREYYVKAHERAWAEDLSRRRTSYLVTLIARGAAERATWRTHAPIAYTERVEHYCTGCNRIRFLRRWWKEKSEALGKAEQPDSDRYMCNHCFANDWPRVVPETYEGRLPGIFKSPELPLTTAHQKNAQQAMVTRTTHPRRSTSGPDYTMNSVQSSYALSQTLHCS
ncbi:unnamed protein product [Aureobasidium mustum]|uniref:Uncharacterized protein n=1 Tax=Aureobasidium mustum TaxID=2773714 RepID=A0A9N8JJ84_9PEZI|nr:unnamed protein product [Aureobasidium mustum]